MGIRIDTHCDSILTVDNLGYSLSFINYHRQFDFPRMLKNNLNIQFMSLYIEEAYKPNYTFQRTIELIELLYKEIEKFDNIYIIKTKDDLQKCFNKKNYGVILSIEGGDGIKSLSILHHIYRQGIRSIGLTWNNKNHLANGAKIISNKGLSKFGFEVVKEMNKLGIAIDVSHLNEKSFWDVIKSSSKPVIASHSNCYSLCNHKRNLKDEQIIALAENNGVICITFETSFLGSNDIIGVIEHIKYVKELVGVDYIGIGSDFDGLYNYPNNLESIDKWKLIEHFLFKEGFSVSEIDKIKGNNVYRLMLNNI